jgi:hypothetical protein
MTLNLDAFNEGSTKKSKTKYKAALGVGSVVSLFGIGSTLAANISLNGGGNVEFGQGVATTAACDEDGFSITPVTVFNNQFSIFMVDYVQVSGVDLTPEGSIDTTNPVEADFTGLGITDQNNSGGIDQADAKLQYPGQYFDGSDWKRTCDGVVLDFKAYTDDINYINRTVYDYGSLSGGNLSKPIGWSQDPYSSDSNGNFSPGFAIVIDVNDAADNFDSNYAGDSVTGDIDNSSGSWGDFDWDMVDYSSPANTTFTFYVNSNNERTDAASISKITVQSMAEFPPNYYGRYEGLGNPDLVWID